MQAWRRNSRCMSAVLSIPDKCEQDTAQCSQSLAAIVQRSGLSSLAATQ